MKQLVGREVSAKFASGKRQSSRIARGAEAFELLDAAKEVARESDFHKRRFGEVGLIAAPLILAGSANVRDLRVRVYVSDDAQEMRVGFYRFAPIGPLENVSDSAGDRAEVHRVPFVELLHEINQKRYPFDLIENYTQTLLRCGPDHNN